jgi:ABC-type transport system substrate-binding protein
MIGLVRVRIQPIDKTANKVLRLLAKLDKVKKTNLYYQKLAEIREYIKEAGWGDVYTTLLTKVNDQHKQDLIRNQDSLNKCGIELQARICILVLGLS